jgi:hypothetical protein
MTQAQLDAGTQAVLALAQQEGGFVEMEVTQDIASQIAAAVIKAYASIPQKPARTTAAA